MKITEIDNKISNLIIKLTWFLYIHKFETYKFGLSVRFFSNAIFIYSVVVESTDRATVSSEYMHKFKESWIIIKKKHSLNIYYVVSGILPIITLHSFFQN